MNPDFTDLAARQFVAVGIHDDDVRAGTRQSDAVDMTRGQFAGIIVDGDVVSVAP